MKRCLPVAGLLAVLAASACGGSKPPARWAEGGAPLHLVSAQWQHKGELVDLQVRGGFTEVVIDGDVEWVIDRVGRLYDQDQKPVAVLEADGRLVGKKDELLGIVGSSYAAQPGRASAWLALSPEGDLIKYAADGAAQPAGRWVGCNVSVYARHACLLVAYAILWDEEGASNSGGAAVAPTSVSPMGIGIGVGR